jgi:hypothetical protein
MGDRDLFKDEARDKTRLWTVNSPLAGATGFESGNLAQPGSSVTDRSD